MSSSPFRWLVAPLAFLAGFAAIAADAPKPLLWRIEGPIPSYIFGTIHLSSPDVTKLASPTEKAVQSADVLLTEVSMDMVDQLKAVTALMGMESLSDVLPKDLYERSEAEVQRINPALNLKPFEKMKIWGLAMTIAMLEEQLKNPGGMPLDMVLFMKAKDAGKEVGGIETFEEQTGVFDAFSKEEQIAMLRATLDDMDRARKEGKSPLDELRTAYLSGDLQVLDRTMNEWMTGLDQKLLARFMDSLLTRRNHIMADRISAKLKATPEKSFFFAVGAGHLPGEEGILKLLEKQGLKLTRATEAP